MTVVHKLTGYDKRRGVLTIEHDIHSDKLRFAADIAKVSKEDPGVIGSYELTPDQAKRIARLINKMINVEIYAWFLEAFAISDSVGAISHGPTPAHHHT